MKTYGEGSEIDWDLGEKKPIEEEGDEKGEKGENEEEKED